MKELDEFIRTELDARELRRALAVKLALQEYDYQWISTILLVSTSFISKWKVMFEEYGVEGLKLSYKGRSPYLTAQEEAAIISWIKLQTALTVTVLQKHIKDNYGVTYKSGKRYYDLLRRAGMSWQKSQPTNPKADPAQIAAKKKEIEEYLTRWSAEIESGKLIVYIIDECHVVWGDICGYLWGPREQRIVLPISNQRARQTYYGALNYNSQDFTVKAYKKGDSDNTIHFITYLRAQHPGKRVAIIWDGASYHTSNAIREYLTELNEGLPHEEWVVELIQFAAYAPEQNPVESIWLKGKTFLREKATVISVFADVKRLFLEHLNGKNFAFPANCSFI